ncbi:MAG TPA: Uma2 family endonuclease [Candidatus Didemnitutus sp.]|nr:Uma2 family endonuclease [Candidatus Didemnitutus sp.]
MSDSYEEIIDGEVQTRRAPSSEHELLLGRIRDRVTAALSPNSALRLLPARSGLQIAEQLTVRPDLAIVRVPPQREDPDVTPQLYLVAEVLQPGDHHLDTVVKKQLWSDLRLPRLWMIDPRYLNVEVYGCGEYGFTLLNILALRDQLEDPLLTGLAYPIADLFAGT